jgi:hypothetical protein
VYQRLRQRGYQVFAVNPSAGEVECDCCYPDLKSVPGGVDWVLIGTRPQTAAATMRECADLGIKRVWMHPGARRGQRGAPGRRVRPPAWHQVSQPRRMPPCGSPPECSGPPQGVRQPIMAAAAAARGAQRCPAPAGRAQARWRDR